jgi:hypothetical protein
MGGGAIVMRGGDATGGTEDAGANVPERWIKKSTKSSTSRRCSGDSRSSLLSSDSIWPFLPRVVINILFRMY